MEKETKKVPEFIHLTQFNSVSLSSTQLGLCKYKLTSKWSGGVQKYPSWRNGFGKSEEIIGSTLNSLSGNTQLEK